MATPTLHTQNLAIGYRLKHAQMKSLHKNINLELHGAEITCLLGPNGSGKSTLIRTLCGFQEALEGKVLIDDLEISKAAATALSQKVSVVLTGPPDIANMSVFSMVAFGRSPYTGFMGRLLPDDKSIVDQALSSTGIDYLRHRMFDELSDGERQKVMIAKSLAQQTPVIILDEPTAFLDFPSKVETLHLLKQAAREQQKAVLLSTHDLNLAIQFADKIWLLGKDKPIVTGVPEDLILNGSFGDFFDKEKTVFDKQTGNFNFSFPRRGKIEACGEGLNYQWLLKALDRSGFLVNVPHNSDEPVLRIFLRPDNKFEITNFAEIVVAETIEETLKILQTFKSQ